MHEASHTFIDKLYNLILLSINLTAVDMYKIT